MCGRRIVTPRQPALPEFYRIPGADGAQYGKPLPIPGADAPPRAQCEWVETRVFPAKFVGPSDSMVQVSSDPDIVHRVMVLEGGCTRSASKAICLPKTWDALLQRFPK